MVVLKGHQGAKVTAWRHLSHAAAGRANRATAGRDGRMRDCAHAGRHLHAPVTRGRVMSIPALQRPLGATRIQEKPMAAPQPAHLRHQQQSRRWLIWLVALAVLTGASAVALAWVTLQEIGGEP